MKDQTILLGAEAFRRISEAPLTEQQRYFLTECVQAYLPIDPAQKAEIEKLLETDKYAGVRAMNKSWFEEAAEKAAEKAEIKGRRDALRESMEERFGPLPAKVTDRLQQMSLAELIPLNRAVLHAKSLADMGF